jgi:hypothetical protein
MPIGNHRNITSGVVFSFVAELHTAEVFHTNACTLPQTDMSINDLTMFIAMDVKMTIKIIFQAGTPPAATRSERSLVRDCQFRVT